MQIKSITESSNRSNTSDLHSVSNHC